MKEIFFNLIFINNNYSKAHKNEIYLNKSNTVEFNNTDITIENRKNILLNLCGENDVDLNNQLIK